MMMQKLKQRSEELCGRLNADIGRIRQQKVCSCVCVCVGGGGKAGVMFGGKWVLSVFPRDNGLAPLHSSPVSSPPPLPCVQGTPLPTHLHPPPPAPIQVALQKHMEGSAKQFATWRVEREKEVSMGVRVSYQTSVLYKTGSTSRLPSSVTVSYSYALPPSPRLSSCGVRTGATPRTSSSWRPFRPSRMRCCRCGRKCEVLAARRVGAPPDSPQPIPPPPPKPSTGPLNTARSICHAMPHRPPSPPPRSPVQRKICNNVASLLSLSLPAPLCSARSVTPLLPARS